MAQIGAVKVIAMVVLIVAMQVMSGSAQDFDAAQAPAPGPNKGAANLQSPLNGALMSASLFMSLLLAIIKH